MTEVSELLKKALALPIAARAALAVSLLDSLGETVDESAEAEWEKEIVRRVAELKAGTVKTIPWTEVRRRSQPRNFKADRIPKNHLANCYLPIAICLIAAPHSSYRS